MSAPSVDRGNLDTYEPCSACEDAEATEHIGGGVYVCGACVHTVSGGGAAARRFAQKMR